MRFFRLKIVLVSRPVIIIAVMLIAFVVCGPIQFSDMAQSKSFPRKRLLRMSQTGSGQIPVRSRATVPSRTQKLSDVNPGQNPCLASVQRILIISVFVLKKNSTQSLKWKLRDSFKMYVIGK